MRDAIARLRDDAKRSDAAARSIDVLFPGTRAAYRAHCRAYRAAARALRALVQR